jgi:HK97 family phage major capsid protein
VLNTPGTQHQDRTRGAPLVDDILRAQTKLALAFFDPTATGLHPLNWEEIRLMRDESGGAGTGQYLFGPPSQAGATTLWGRPVVSGPQFVEDQPVVADWRTVEFYLREGVQVLASDSHADFFIRNLVAILAEMRAAVVVPQPEAICEVSEGS